MKQITTILFAILVPYVLSAAPLRFENSFAIRGGVGYNNVDNYLPETFALGGVAVQFGVGYRHHDVQSGFLFHAGLEVGYGLSMMRHEDLREERAMYDTELEPMTMMYDFSAVRETQHNVMAGVEVLFGYQHAKGVYFLLGPKVAYAFYNPVSTSSTVTTSGRYDNLIEDFTDMPDHFFSTQQNRGLHVYPSVPKVSLYVELGHTIHLSNWRLQARGEKTKDMQIALFAEYGGLFHSHRAETQTSLVASYSDGMYMPEVNPFLWYNVNSNFVGNLTCGIKLTYLINWRTCPCRLYKR